MSYDNDKFHAAFDAWLEENVELGYGEHYAGELLEDFCSFLDSSKMMKRSPGRVVFGKRLKEKGFERRKSQGRTYWSGLKLKTPRTVAPTRYRTSIVEEAKEAALREFMELQERSQNSQTDRKKWLEHFRKEIEKDTPEYRRSVGDAEGTT